jgi:hypothetical protein
LDRRLGGPQSSSGRGGEEKREEMGGGGDWRRLHSEELPKLYASPNIIRVTISGRLRWAGHIACMGEMRNAYSTLMGKPERKRPLGRPGRRWEDNIRLYLKEIVW